MRWLRAISVLSGREGERVLACRVLQKRTCGLCVTLTGAMFRVYLLTQHNCQHCTMLATCNIYVHIHSQCATTPSSQIEHNIPLDLSLSLFLSLPLPLSLSLHHFVCAWNNSGRCLISPHKHFLSAHRKNRFVELEDLHSQKETWHLWPLYPWSMTTFVGTDMLSFWDWTVQSILCVSFCPEAKTRTEKRHCLIAPTCSRTTSRQSTRYSEHCIHSGHIKNI